MGTTDSQALAKDFGFDLELSIPVKEIDGSAHVFRHITGARLLFLENEDNNKGFSITFKTPANDDTGVFHILEHSVLCGSEKYPVKEPFVNLLKSSMQTFLNAMTFPDKTMYPVASTNNKDLLNLASVYLDAVFHPNIYSNMQIFEQEGWHLEYDSEGEGSLEYNGVVFNEMKGALSDPESVLFDTLSASLFPDTTYRFESGGTPDAIPTLSYEGFLDTHSRHYCPSNSYIVLYGNLDLASFLELIDENLRNANEGSDAINPLDLQKPVIEMGVKREMVTSPDSSCAALGFVTGKASERERMVAIQVLIDAIMGSNEAPMKRALLDAGIADEVEGVTVNSVAQPFVVITARGLHGDCALEALQEKVAEVAKELCEGSLDRDIIDASLNHAEFVMREGEFGVADGVYYSMAAMLGWLYDSSPESALLYIRYEDTLKTLREKVFTGYFENLIEEIFLGNEHVASAEIVPVENEATTKADIRLKDLESQMTPEQLEDIAIEAKALHEAQMAPDSPEDLAKLPRLSREDVGDHVPEPPCRFLELGQIEVMRHDVETHGIAYVTKYFDMGRLSFKELPYASILSLVLGKMGTEHHSAQEIDTLVQSKLGSLSFSCETYSTSEKDDDVKVFMAVRASCLSCNVAALADIVNEILTETVFDDLDRIENILTQYKVGKEQQFVMSGDGIASVRAASYTIPSAAIAEQMSNIDFYKHVKMILANFDTDAEKLASKLKEIADRLFTDDGCLLSFAGSDEDFEIYCDAGAQLGIAGIEPERRLEIPPLSIKNEAFAVPADIVYCALACNRDDVVASGSEFSGLWMMAARVLSYDYLWNEVRVVGGAYGVRFNSMRLGTTTFSSFRDPHVRETFDRFRAAGEWLRQYDPHKEEFEGFVVSTAASFDKPMKVRSLVRRQASMYLSGYAYEDYLKYRSQVLDSKVEDLTGLSEAIAQICEAGNICIMGNKTLIEQSGMGIPVIELFDL